MHPPQIYLQYNFLGMDEWMDEWKYIYPILNPFYAEQNIFFSKKKFNNEYIIIHEDKTFWIFYFSFMGFY